MPSKLLILLLLFSHVCYAEKADRDKPINIEADQAQVDDAKQTSNFSGKVLLEQGTMVIHGDKLLVEQDKAGFKHCTVLGKTASFKQKREGLDEYIEGYGELIEYDEKNSTIDFYTQARVKRGQDEVRGEHVTYNSTSEIFKADDNGVTALGKPTRVHAVLYPKPAVKTPETGVKKAANIPVTKSDPSVIEHK
jgi:lipopolysaccharide export system protein LptA